MAGAERVWISFADTVGVAWYRCYVPSVALKSLGYEVGSAMGLPTDWEDYDVFLVQRPFGDVANWSEVMWRIQRAGKRVFMELDDDYWHLERENPAFAHWNEGKGAALRNMEAFLLRCDGVTTTTRPLADVLSRFCANVRIVPNLLPDEQWLPYSRGVRRRPVVGWTGGEAHIRDVAVMERAILAALEEGADVRLAGLAHYPFDPHPRMIGIPTVPVPLYAKLLTRLDIGLGPLIDNAFNRAKSDLKFIEYGFLCIPGVFSAVTPYLESVNDGVDGFIATSPKDWDRLTRRLVRDRDLREEMGAAAKARADARMLSGNAHLWEKALGLGGAG